MHLAIKIGGVILVLLHLSQDKGLQLYEKACREFYRLRGKTAAAEVVARLADIFALVQDQAPTSRRADDALYMAGTLYLDAFDRSGREEYLERSIHYFKKLWKLYPSSRYADDALYFLAEINRVRLNRISESIKYYRIIVTRYKNGDKYVQARYWLRHLHVSERVTLKPENLKVWSYSSYARVVIQTGTRVLYFYNRLPGGKKGVKNRVYIDLEPSVLAPGNISSFNKTGIIKNIRLGQFKKTRVRIVLDIGEEQVEYRVFHFDDPFRIVIDVFTSGEERDILAGLLEPYIEKTEEKPAKEPVPQTRKQKKEVEKQPPLTPVLVVIDPGHGGKDPGAIGRYGTKEKDVTLRLAKLVKQKLEKRGIKVVLTRDRDVFIPLEERTAIANSLRADLFVSIHANASRKRSARGLEVYYFEKTSDRDVLRLAAQENNVRSLKQLSEVQYILFDMVARYKARLSSMLADFVQRETYRHVRRLNRTRNLGSKPGPFYVLKNALMPSVLVETSFISNPKEEKLLRNPEYISAIAEGIVRGIIKFLKHQKKISI